MQIETFPDGSTIETDEVTGNRSVCGTLAHTEYLRRLREEQITVNTDYAVIAYCLNLDGSRKAELIRQKVTNPITQDAFGPFAWKVWRSAELDKVTHYRDEDHAREAFSSAMLHGTNV